MHTQAQRFLSLMETYFHLYRCNTRLERQIHRGKESVGSHSQCSNHSRLECAVHPHTQLSLQGKTPTHTLSHIPKLTAPHLHSQFDQAILEFFSLQLFIAVCSCDSVTCASVWNKTQNLWLMTSQANIYHPEIFQVIHWCLNAKDHDW